jgi:dTDP-4-amino-4,6-dideoxygalactose transaminase
MRVPFLNLKAQHDQIVPELRRALDSVFSESSFILGPEVERFEQSFAAYIGARHCIGLNSGTSALHLALLACGIGPGDEVITTPHTWISTCWAISYVGAKPVFADIDPTTYTLDPIAAEKAVTPRTRAILPVHLYGQSSDMKALVDLARKFNLSLIEDAAQAHGAMFAGQRVGTFGRAGCFSFYPGKNLGACGEGGAVITDDAGIAQRIRQLRDHAQESRHHHVEIGFNMRMEGLQGAILNVKLSHLDDWTRARAKHADHYSQLLADVPGLELPRVCRPRSHVWHLYVVLVPPGTRDGIRESLLSHGIATGVHYPTPVHLQPAYSHLSHRRGDFPVSEDVMSRCLSLPMYPELESEQVSHTASVLREVMISIHSKSNGCVRETTMASPT